MSLQALVGAIHAEGAAAVSQIEAEADRKIEAIRIDGARDAAQARREAAEAALRPLQAERKPLLLQAQMDATRSWEAARALLVETALAATTKRLHRLREQAEYPRLMSRLLLEAVEALDVSGPLRVEVDPRDEALIRKLIDEDGILGDRPVTIHPHLPTSGGLRLATPDGALRLDNRVETRMDRVLPELRTRLGLFFTATVEKDA
jgi:vacuolar-type H+-ATPase subunit E/Vma4